MKEQKSVTNKAILDVSKDYCLPILKEYGFKRRSPHFFRTQQEIIHGIHFQASQWGNIDSGSFTVNLNITSDRLYKYWAGKPLPKNPATAGWPIQIRLGDVCPEGHDLWWGINSRSDIPKIGNDVATRIIDYGLKFFANFKTIKDIRKAIISPIPPAGFIEAQAPMIEAMILVEEGETSKAKQLIDKEIMKWNGKPFCESVYIVASRLGLMKQ